MQYHTLLPCKFIYFDLDDTLLDHTSAEAAALRDVYRHYSIFEDTTPDLLADTYQQVNSEQWSLYSRGKVSREQLQRNRFEKTLSQLDLDTSRYDEVGTFYMQCYRNHWRWTEGADEAYRQVQKHYPVGILTNGFAETQQKKLEEFDLYRSTDQIVISEKVGALKPDPQVFEYATNLAEVEPHEILYVGDSLVSDIEGGANFGWNTAWFTKNGNLDSHEKADFVFSNFEALKEWLDM